jgi:hypothetical protein
MSTRHLKFTWTALLLLGAHLIHAAEAPTKPPIGHVFVIVLENKGYADTFGPHSKAPYLSQQLTQKGVLLSQYFGTAHYSLGNYLAMISGQGGTRETRNDCEVFEDFVSTGTTTDGQEKGYGCVYPAHVQTLADQLMSHGKAWRGYMEDLGKNPRRESQTCGAPPIGAADPTQGAEKGDQYAARHNPFVYFHSLLDNEACAANVGGLDRLAVDLQKVSTTPSFAFISPNLCNDGHDAPCKDGAPGGLISADAFLKTWVTRIMASPAYRKDGLLIVTFDEGDSESTTLADGRTQDIYEGESCCDQQPGPNIGPFPFMDEDAKYVTKMTSFGGDRTGAVLLSPFLKPGTTAATPFNHYALLKTLEDIFGLSTHLGYAARPGLIGFFESGSDVRMKKAIE